MKTYIQIIHLFLAIMYFQFGFSQKTTTQNKRKSTQDLVIVSEENKTLSLNASQLLSNQTIQWQESLNNRDWNDIEGAVENNYEVTLVNLPKYYRSIIREENCGEFFRSDIVSVFAPEPTDKLFWSDPNTWETLEKPKEGERVVIPSDKHIYLDENTPDLGDLIILGTLEFERQDLSLTAKSILVNEGALIVGENRKPFIHKAIITLNDTDLEHNVMGQMGTRGIIVVGGGKLELHGKSPEIAWTKINEHAEDRATKLILAEQADWNAGDEIVLGPTDFYEAADGKSVSQRMEITNINLKEVDLNTAIEAFHWGKLQYATTNGMSLIPDDLVGSTTVPREFSYDIDYKNPNILDQRAPVGNLTRNIVVNAPNDEQWQNEGFGVHIMIMPSAIAHLDGVEIKRGGQRGRVRRYPFHWHMLSYRGTETLGDATGQYIQNSTINESKNRGIVVHGTNGTLVKNNIIYNVKGHAIFTENAVERRNTFEKNLILKVRNPETQYAIKKHELEGFNIGSSGFWISNPDNITINNHVADSEGTGYWIALPTRPFGESSEVLYTDGEIMNPKRMMFGVFDDNTAHTCRGDALHHDHGEINEEGKVAVGNLKYYLWDSTGRDVIWPRTTWQRYSIRNFSGWKSNSAIWHRASYGSTIQPVSADNVDISFAGSGDRGLVIGGLVVGRSLNHERNSSSYNNLYVRPAFATYHHTFSMMGNIIVNFPATDGKKSGAFSTVDLYLRPVEKGHWLSFDNRLINSHPGVKLTASESNTSASGADPLDPHFNLAGAIWDPQGIWGPQNNYVVFDRPFYTHGHQVEIILPNTEISGGVSVSGPFYGLQDYVVKHSDGTSRDLAGKKFIRYTNDLNEVDSFTLNQNSSPLLQNMKDCAAQKGGVYEVDFVNLEDVYDVEVRADNFLTESDELVVAFEFSGSKNAKVSSKIPFTNKTVHEYVGVNSFLEVQESDTEVYWQDNANNKVWVKMKGGRMNNDFNLIFWEKNVYQSFTIKIQEQ